MNLTRHHRKFKNEEIPFGIILNKFDDVIDEELIENLQEECSSPEYDSE